MGRPQATVPPWHLWGNTERVTIPPSSLFVSDPNRIFVPSTIIKVAYGRPETWRFQFGAEIINGPTVGAGITAETNIDFRLITGVGRGVMRRGVGFGRDIFRFRWGGGGTPTPAPIGETIWHGTMSSGQPYEWNEVDGSGASIARFEAVENMDSFVAESITVEANCNFIVSLPLPITLGPLVLELSWQVAPLNHVRPDWYEENPVFAGGETEGR